MNTSPNTAADNSTKDSDQLLSMLQQFTGTESWYRHSLVKQMLYTDGVRYFAENAGEQGAYWFLDTVALYIYPLLKKELFLVINLLVDNQNKAVIKADDGNDHEILSQSVSFTDVQEGKWTFYLTDNVMLLTSEY